MAFGLLYYKYERLLRVSRMIWNLTALADSLLWLERKEPHGVDFLEFIECTTFEQNLVRVLMGSASKSHRPKAPA